MTLHYHRCRASSRDGPCTCEQIGAAVDRLEAALQDHWAATRGDKAEATPFECWLIRRLALLVHGGPLV